MYTLRPKGYLAKFCYDKVNPINFTNKNVWVPNIANPRGPKRKWVPKSPPLVFDVGVGSHMTWEDWRLGGGCMGSMDIQLMHRYQGSLVGRPPCFGDLENSSYGLVTISKLPFSLHAFTSIIFLACFDFVLLVVNTCLSFLLELVYILV